MFLNALDKFCLSLTTIIRKDEPVVGEELVSTLGVWVGFIFKLDICVFGGRTSVYFKIRVEVQPPDDFIVRVIASSMNYNVSRSIAVQRIAIYIKIHWICFRPSPCWIIAYDANPVDASVCVHLYI